MLNFLANLSEISTIVAIIAGILGIAGTISGLYMKYSTKAKERKTKKQQVIAQQQELPKVLKSIDERLIAIESKQNSSQEEIKELKEKFDHLETQELRYMINDSFLGYNNIHEVPNEQLLNAADCCEIYLAKGLNHATGARCKLIAAEIDRREKKRAEGKKDGNETTDI